MLDLNKQFGVVSDGVTPQFQPALCTVRIQDRICSAGKTSDMIEGLRPSRQYLIVTPLLHDVQSIIDRAKIDLVQPEERPALRCTNDPYSFSHTKRGHLQELLISGHSVVCTHKLYTDIAWAANQGYLAGYDIIIDEVPQTSEILTSATTKPAPGQINSLVWKNQYLRDHYATVDENGQVHPTAKWQRDVLRGENTMSKQLFDHASAGCLWSSGETVLVWELPVSLLTSGRSITVMTYRFRGSLLQAFMEKHQIDYRVHANPVEEARLRAKAKDLITLKAIPGLENIKFSANALDPGKLKPGDQLKLVNALRNLRRNDLKDAQSGSVLVTCLKGLWYLDGKSASDLPLNKKPQQGPICKQGKRTTGLYGICRWSANVTRGTNSYRDCTSILYLYDKHLNPGIARTLGVPPSGTFNDLYAISEAVQFIYRSAIRKRDHEGTGEPYVPVTVYVPSERMRTLLQRWLDGKI